MSHEETQRQIFTESTGLLQNCTVADGKPQMTFDPSTPILSASTSSPIDQDVIMLDQYKSTTINQQHLTTKPARPLLVFVVMILVALSSLHLCFLPRTSLRRDLRRWRGNLIPTSNLRRNFVAYTLGNRGPSRKPSESYLEEYMSEFKRLNGCVPVNMVSDDNTERVAFIKELMNKFGMETETHAHDFSHLHQPISLAITLHDTRTGDVIRHIQLKEQGWDTPSYLPFGANGTVKAGYIYCNMGTSDDYRHMEQHGLSVLGKIAVIKVLPASRVSQVLSIAENHGAIGAVIYFSIPRPLNMENSRLLNHSVSRDSGACGPLSDMHIPHIPAIPASLASIKFLLSETTVSDSTAFPGWDFLPIESSSLVELKMNTEFKEKQNRNIINIMGKIQGSSQDGVVILGAKHDALTSSNPLSGQAILLEIMRNMQFLVRDGWKPLRTIKFVAWDASESGMIGSQLEAHTSTLCHGNCLAYINIDGDAVMGSRLRVDANPVFNLLLRQVASLIPINGLSDMCYMKSSIFCDINNGKYIVESIPLTGSSEDPRYTTLKHYWMSQDNATIGNNLYSLLEKSDALVFQSHLNTPIVNIKFENDMNVDTSIYVPGSNMVSLEWLLFNNIDPVLSLHGLLVRYLGVFTISLTEREVNSYDLLEYTRFFDSSLASIIGHYAVTIKDWAGKNVLHSLVRNSKLLQDYFYQEKVKPLQFQDLVKQTRLILLKLMNLARNANKANVEIQTSLETDYPWYKCWNKIACWIQCMRLNKKIFQTEKLLMLTSKDYAFLGIQPSFYSHAVFGNHDRYRSGSCSAFSGLDRALAGADFDLSVKWLIVIYKLLSSYSSVIS